MKASVLHGSMAGAHSQLQNQLFQMSPALAAVGTACGGGIQIASLFQEVETPVVLSDPGSDLTSHLSGSRKRARDELALPVPAMPPTSNIMYGHHQLQQQQHALLQNQKMLQDVLSVKSSRANQSAMTSTSGRSPLLPSVVSQGNNTASSHITPTSSSSCLVSLFHQKNLEVDVLVRLHAQRLQSVLDEAKKRQCRSAVAAVEQYAQRRVSEKQAELKVAIKRNADLEDRLKQSATETQAWFTAAKNSEALVAGLRASIEQILLQKLNGGGDDCVPKPDFSCSANTAEEGYGDSEEDGITATVTAASGAVFVPVPCAEASSSLVGSARNKPSSMGTRSSFPCRRCGESDASVLVLPCRHLCLCPSCDAFVQECPVCSNSKKASLQINLS